MGSIRTKTLKNGNQSFEVAIRNKGVNDVSRSFKTKKEAEDFLAEQDYFIRTGKRLHSKGSKCLFSDAVDAFLQAHKLIPAAEEKKSLKEQNELILCVGVKARLGNFAMEKLDAARLNYFIEAMLKTSIPKPHNKKKDHYLYDSKTDKKYSKSTVRKHVLQIKKIMLWHAEVEKYDIPMTTFANLKVPGGWTNQRERRLEDGEWEKLLAAIQTGYSHRETYPILLELYIETAARSQELLKAKWKDVHFGHKEIKIPKENVKTKTYRAIPMSRRCYALLEQLKAIRGNPKPEDLLFHEFKDTLALSHSFKRLTHRANVVDLKIHDLRHEAISRFFEKTTLSDVEIMKVAGHTNANTLKRYAVLRSVNLSDKMG